MHSLTKNIKINSSLHVPKLIFREPRRNLPSNTSRKNAERNYTIAFARAYVSQIVSIHHKIVHSEINFAREIPINGLGIADFVVIFRDAIKLNNKEKASSIFSSSVIRAFELKMTNWRKALMQAHRYKYFANVSIVILPPEILKTASRFLDTFKSVKIGLWGFNARNNRIIQLYTPRPSKPFVIQYKLRAMKLVSKASKLSISLK